MRARPDEDAVSQRITYVRSVDELDENDRGAQRVHERAIVTLFPNGDRVTENAFGTFVHRKVAHKVWRTRRGKSSWRLISSVLKKPRDPQD